jgi:hypothetical protein
MPNREYVQHGDVANDRPQSTAGSVLDLARLRYLAWWTEHACRAELRIHDWRSRVRTQHAAFELQCLEARLSMAKTATRVVDQEAELWLRHRLSNADSAEQHRILDGEVMTQRLMVEREHLLHLRESGSLPPLEPSTFYLSSAAARTPELPPVPPEPPKPEDIGAFELDLSDRQIENLALKAVALFSQLDREAADSAWKDWRAELEKRLPRYTAVEVAQRAEELRRLMR